MKNKKTYPVGWISLKGRVDIYTPKIVELHKLAYMGNAEARGKLDRLSKASMHLISEASIIEGGTIRIDLNKPW